MNRAVVRGIALGPASWYLYVSEDTPTRVTSVDQGWVCFPGRGHGGNTS